MSSNSRLLLLASILGACGPVEAPPCPAEEDRFVPMTALMEAAEPAEDTAGEGEYVLCPDGAWYTVERRLGTYISELTPQDFELAETDSRWVAGPSGTFCFSWLEFHAWAIRIEYDYSFVSDEVAADAAEGWILSCDS